MAQYIDTAGQQMPGGMTSSMMHKPTDNANQDQSLLSGIKDMFMSVAFKGDGSSVGEINSQTRKMLDKGQQETIRRSLQSIDNVLKKECIYCGSILIDMIDNDVEATAKESEFADTRTKRQYSVAKGQGTIGVEDEWEIK